MPFRPCDRLVLMCFDGPLTCGLYDVIQIMAPTFTLTRLPYHQSNEQFLQYFPDKKSVPAGELFASWKC